MVNKKKCGKSHFFFGGMKKKQYFCAVFEKSNIPTAVLLVRLCSGNGRPNAKAKREPGANPGQTRCCKSYTKLSLYNAIAKK